MPVVTTTESAPVFGSSFGLLSSDKTFKAQFIGLSNTPYGDSSFTKNYLVNQKENEIKDNPRDSDQWDCKTCLVKNENDKEKCICCQSLRDTNNRLSKNTTEPLNY